MTPLRKTKGRRRVVDFSAGNPNPNSSSSNPNSETTQRLSLAAGLPRATRSSSTDRVQANQHERDLRPQSSVRQPVHQDDGSAMSRMAGGSSRTRDTTYRSTDSTFAHTNRESGQQSSIPNLAGERTIQHEPSKRPVIEWQPSPDFNEHLDRMREYATETDCAETVEVMLQMVNAVEGFQSMGSIFRGPSRREVDAAQAQRKTGERDAREHLWREINAHHRQFDRTDAAGASDWLRVLEVMRAAMIAEGEKPSVFDVQAPHGQGDRGNAAWQPFLRWCIENHLDAQRLVATAERLRGSLGVTGRADILHLAEQIEQTSTQQLDQVIMAGFGVDNLFVNIHGYFQRLEQVMVELDPTIIDRRFAIARTARDEYERSPEFRQERRRVESDASAAWDDQNAYRRRQRGNATLNGRLSDVWEQAYRAESTYTEPVLISRQSTAFDRQPTACFIGIESMPQQERHSDSEHLLGSGVHAVRAEVIGMLAGEDKLVVHEYEQRFDINTGKVLRPEAVHLLDITGPMLENRSVEISGEAATTIIADWLTKETEQIYSSHAEKLNLGFVHDNNRLITERAEQWQYRSRRRLQQRENFNLNAWYQERLTEMGHPASVEEIRQANLERLILQPADILECPTGDIETVVSEVERDYPETVEIENKSYRVDYHYEPEQNDDTGYLTAVIGINYLGRENPALLWTAERVPSIGPANEPVALQFAARVGHQTEIFTSLQDAQDAIDWRYLEEQWRAYEYNGWQKEIIINPDGDFPDAATLIVDDFPDGLPKYATAKNGSSNKPYPAIQHHFGDAYHLVLRRTAVLANKDNDKSREMFGRRKVAAAEDRARQERVAAIDPLQIKALQDAAEKIKTISLAQAATNPFAERARWDVDSAAGGVERALHEGKIEEAQKKLERAQLVLREQVTEPFELWLRARELYEGLSSKPFHFPQEIQLKPKHLDLETYKQPPRRAWGDERRTEPLPTTEQLKSLIQFLEKLDVKQKQQKAETDAYMAAYDAKIERWKSMDQQLRRTEMEKFLRRAEASIAAIQARVNKNPQPGLNAARARFVRDVLTDTRRTVADRIWRAQQEIDQLRRRSEIEPFDIENAERKAEHWAKYDPGEFGHFNSIEQNLTPNQPDNSGSSNGQRRRRRKPRTQKNRGNNLTILLLCFMIRIT